MSSVRIAVGGLVLVTLYANLARADAITSDPGGWTFWLSSTGAMVPPASSSVAPVPMMAQATPPPPPPPVSFSPPAPSSNTPIVAAPPAPAVPPPPPVPDFSQHLRSANALINLGTGPYPNASAITTGGAMPWFDSPQVTNLFGGTPTAQQQSDFASTVLQRAEQTFQLAGVPVTLTTDPSVPVAHTLSVVSQTSSQLSAAAIGMTEIGGSGFSFIDPIAKSSQSVDQLEWAVAHNVAHELMLAFGVPENYDKSGDFIDATNAKWAMMTSPNSTFSPDAAKALLASNFQNQYVSSGNQAAQIIETQPVPEPAAVLLWTLGAVVVAARFARRRAA